MPSRTSETPEPAPSPGQEVPLPEPIADIRSQFEGFSFPSKKKLPENDKGPTARPGNVSNSAEQVSSTSRPTTSPTLDPPVNPGPKHIIVLGAGIIGLQTALTILSSEETKHFKVTIIAEHTPSDHTSDYTSPLAGGYWRSDVGVAQNIGLAASQADLRTLERQKFDLDTYTHWINLCDSWTEGIINQALLDDIPSKIERDNKEVAQDKEYKAMQTKMEARCGIGWRKARYYWGKETAETAYKNGTSIWWLDRVGASTLDPKHEKLRIRLEGKAEERKRLEQLFTDLELHSTYVDAWEHWPGGATMGISYRSICFDPDKYLKWVMRQVMKKGGKVIKTKVATEHGLEGVVRGAKKFLLDKLSQGERAEYCEVSEDSGDEEKSPNALKRLSSASAKSIRKLLPFRSRESSGSRKGSASSSRPISTSTLATDLTAMSEDVQGDPEIVAIVNCAGGSARHFASEQEKNSMYPIRGQTILVKGSARQCRTYVDYPDAKFEERLYVVPRPGTDTTALGGCRQVKSWDNELETEVDEEMNTRIIEGIKNFKLAEDLRTGPDGEFEIIDEYEDGSQRCSVGFHPARDGGPRVELESENGGKVDGTYVLHNYGHDGAGYQSSVGCAEKIRKLITELE